MARQQSAERCWLLSETHTLELLVQHTARDAEAGEIGARQLATVAVGVAGTSIPGESLGVLLRTLARASEQRVHEFNAQGLTNTVWAFATVGKTDEKSNEKLFAVFANAAEQRMGEFTAQALSNTAWAFAKIG